MDEVIKLVTTQGLAVAISVIVIYGMYQLMNIFIDKLRDKVGMKSHDQLLDIRSKINMRVQNVIDIARIKTNSYRISVYEFHNGHMNIGGLPFLKMTNTYQSYTDTTIVTQGLLSDIPLSLLNKSVNSLISRDYLILDSTNKSADLAILAYDLLEQQGASKGLYIKITDHNKKVIGFVVMHVCGDTNITTTDIDVIDDLSIELGALLSMDY